MLCVIRLSLRVRPVALPVGLRCGSLAPPWLPSCALQAACFASVARVPSASLTGCVRLAGLICRSSFGWRSTRRMTWASVTRIPVTRATLRGLCMARPQSVRRRLTLRVCSLRRLAWTSLGRRFLLRSHPRRRRPRKMLLRFAWQRRIRLQLRRMRVTSPTEGILVPPWQCQWFRSLVLDAFAAVEPNSFRPLF